MEAAVIDKVVKEADKPDGKLILAEEIAEGRVTWRSMMLFLKGLGGDKPIFFMTAWMMGIALMHGGSMLGVWFLGFWGSQYETHAPEEVHVTLYASFRRFPARLAHFNSYLVCIASFLCILQSWLHPCWYIFSQRLFTTSELSVPRERLMLNSSTLFLDQLFGQCQQWFRPRLYVNCSIDGWMKHLQVVSSLVAHKTLLPSTDRLPNISQLLWNWRSAW